MFCSNCGNPVDANAVFCPRCGETISAAVKARRGPSNLMIALAALVALASVVLAVRSFFWRRAAATDPRAQVHLAITPSPTATATPAPSPTAAIVMGEYQTYHNDRFDFSVDYPANYLHPRGAFGNGDGQQFVSEDGRVTMRAFGQYNAQDRTLDELLNEAQTPSREITYQVSRKNWFVVSGYEGAKVFYQKTMLDDDAIKTFYIEADRALQPLVQPMTEKIAKTFK